MQDIQAGRGVAVIDPHGDLFSNLLARISRFPEIWGRIVIFDPLDPDWVIGFNPLVMPGVISKERLAHYLTDVVIKVWKLKPEQSPRMVWLMTNSFLAMANLGLTLLDLPRWLIDTEYREELMPRLNNQAISRYFREEYPKSNTGMHQWATPVLNKLGALIYDPDIRLIFSGKSTINFRLLMDEGKVLLVNAPKGILGESMSSLLAAFIVAHIQKAALSRANNNFRQAFYLYLDEFQHYTTDNIQDILSESRKYALSLILAHQYLRQVPSNLRSAVLNTAGTIVTFRVGYKDAIELVKEIFPKPDFLASRKLAVKLRANLMPIRLSNHQRTSNGWESLSRELASLSNREFWMRKRGSFQPIKQSSFWMPNPKDCLERRKAIQALRDVSGRRYARPKKDVQAKTKDEMLFDTDLPFWTS